jgi:hypothetical protein
VNQTRSKQTCCKTLSSSRETKNNKPQFMVLGVDKFVATAPSGPKLGTPQESVGFFTG